MDEERSKDKRCDPCTNTTTVFGGLIIMSCITIAAMRRGVLLHKLILLELVLAYWQSFNMFWDAPAYGWWLSTAAVLLPMSTSLHNVIAWLKLRPFLTPRNSRLFIGSIILVQPYWVFEVYNTFTYYNATGLPSYFTITRPVELVFRDPWWVASCACLIWTITRSYEMSVRQVLAASPRFALMMLAMLFSLVFVLLDVLSATDKLDYALPVGVNPFWKLALVFKCLTDTLILDDFKTALDRLSAMRMANLTQNTWEERQLVEDGGRGRKKHAGGGGGSNGRGAYYRDTSSQPGFLELESQRSRSGSGGTSFGYGLGSLSEAGSGSAGRPSHADLRFAAAGPPSVHLHP